MPVDPVTPCKCPRAASMDPPAALQQLARLGLHSPVCMAPKPHWVCMRPGSPVNEPHLTRHGRPGARQAEYRVSIYGRNRKEWDGLADWVVDHQLFSPHNRWLIQVPRLYGLYQSSRVLRTFSEMLDNIFVPLFEVGASPDEPPIYAPANVPRVVALPVCTAVVGAPR